MWKVPPSSFLILVFLDFLHMHPGDRVYVYSLLFWYKMNSCRSMNLKLEGLSDRQVAFLLTKQGYWICMNLSKVFEFWLWSRPATLFAVLKGAKSHDPTNIDPVVIQDVWTTIHVISIQKITTNLCKQNVVYEKIASVVEYFKCVRNLKEHSDFLF